MTGSALARLRARLARAPERSDPTGRIEAAVALVLARRDDAPVEMLFIERASHPSDPWSGHMALPGGRRDDADADLMATAMRETLEETGIRLAPEQLLGELDDLAPQIPLLTPVLVRPFVFLLDGRPEVVPSHEVSSHLWFPLEDLPGAHEEAVVEVADRERRVPAYVLGDKVVWGITYRIISSGLEADWN
jgi:8-oxo-dGTP pyrophosphatase MutT (NUDIX family)